MTPSPIRWSPGTGQFYHIERNAGSMPDDAVIITHGRHAELLAGQGAGRRIIAGQDGRPQLAPLRKPTAGALRGLAIADTKREAARRITAIASIEKQSNDNALIALAALTPDAERAGALAAAIDRRRRIDAIRSGSDAIEARIASWSAAALARFDPADPALWPAE